MRLIDGDALKRKAQKAATEAWKTGITAKVETILNQFIDWISEAPAVNEWTSVKDRLPKKNGNYLVISNSPICQRILIASFAKNLEKADACAFPFRGKKRPGWYDYDSDWGYFEYDNVTHWMPLPEMPEGVNDNAES